MNLVFLSAESQSVLDDVEIIKEIVSLNERIEEILELQGMLREV